MQNPAPYTCKHSCERDALKDEIERLREENARLREVISYVETSICNSASSYSVYALDGLFGSTCDKTKRKRK